ncbi:hypothetical protein [Microvirga antarctica]|uniref:hypothetical protein n=1 Tax=Microvirga antarctica TaxID=2819233 RepID=UPI001B311CC1|nr:hypothetical protein [Microvirga antarctica]
MDVLVKTARSETAANQADLAVDTMAIIALDAAEYALVSGGRRPCIGGKDPELPVVTG